MFAFLGRISDCFKDTPIQMAKNGLAEAQRQMMHHQSAANYHRKQAEHYEANAQNFKRFLTEQDRSGG